MWVQSDGSWKKIPQTTTSNLICERPGTYLAPTNKNKSKVLEIKYERKILLNLLKTYKGQVFNINRKIEFCRFTKTGKFNC